MRPHAQNVKYQDNFIFMVDQYRHISNLIRNFLASRDQLKWKLSIFLLPDKIGGVFPLQLIKKLKSVQTQFQ